MSNSIIDDRFYFSSETISLIKYYSGSTFVIKYGGSAMKDEFMQSNIINDICLLSSLGINIILVHGGGHIIDNWLKKLDIDPVFHNGIRITDFNTVEVVEMVLSAKVNKHLVTQLNNSNVLSVGLSCKDANLIMASPISSTHENYTGKVEKVNPAILTTLLSNNFLPVVSSVASDVYGNTYNLNADTAASFIAAALSVDKYIMITDTPGVLQDLNKPDSLMKNLNIDQVNQMKADGMISGGMIPKLDSCVYSLLNNVKEAHIIDGRLRHSLLYEILTFTGSGSKIIK
uniref:Acetylglutamate kinase n=1 Tax=Polysiphonia infestans TaxID=2006978 RepID=A0A1Z1MED5_9FLOR|nr:acetylglutamate kinase [Polysiphonia infestans]ARW64437.1 acetylglutamate kinase [Polysiphonia infestans]